jgi:YwiC-like protein
MRDQMSADTARGALQKTTFLPREHGATAMLLTPIICAAILAREWRWSELVTLIAAIAALAAKDPMVVLARQRFVWKQRHPETAAAARWLAGWIVILILCGLVLVATWPLTAIIALGLGVCFFSALAVVINLKNRQRSTLFQVVSAAALTSSSLATCLSATGSIARWCWWLWLLTAMQAAAGILVVHARLDARIASRGTAPASGVYRRAAQGALGLLACAAIAAAILGRIWIALALLVAVAGYWYDLRGQRNREALQIPLKKVGQRALVLSSLYAALLIVGLW